MFSPHWNNACWKFRYNVNLHIIDSLKYPISADFLIVEVTISANIIKRVESLKWIGIIKDLKIILLN